MAATGDQVLLTIEKPAAGGRMIARLDGRVVLVSGAIPGEIVTARLQKVSKSVLYAIATGITQSSPDRRREIPDPSCGGCLYGHIRYERQLALKALVVEDAFARIGRLTPPAPVVVLPSPESGYRMRARLHVRGRRVGFFREGTHEICDARPTRQLLPETCDTLDRLAAAVASLGLSALAEIELAENVEASQRVVYLDGRDAVDQSTLARLAATDGLSGLAAAGSARGDSHVVDAIAIADGHVISLRRHVLAFFQGNRHLLAPFVRHVIDQVPQGSSVHDLYAGVGLFAVGASIARGSSVTAVEGDRTAALDLQANASSAGGGILVRHAPVEGFLKDASRPDVVIVDPPRTGMSHEALDGVASLGALRIIHVSCDVATLARDARKLVDGGYRLTRLDAFDLFPNTPHIETVSVFDR